MKCALCGREGECPSCRRWRESPSRQRLGRVLGFCQKHCFALQIPLILAYRLALDVVYRGVIVPVYAYSGYRMNFHPVFYGCTVLALLVFSPAVARLQQEGTPSANLVTFLNYLYFIPLTSYCGCCWQDMPFFLMGMSYWAVLLLLQFTLPVLRLRPLGGGYGRGLFLLATLLSAGLVMAVSGRYAGFRLTFNLLDVYGIRAEAAGYALPGLVSYALSMAGSVLAILLVYWLARRNYLMCAALVAVYLFLFSISGLKSLFFYLLLVLAAYFLFRPWMRQWLPVLASGACAAAFLEYRVVHTYYLAGFLLNRLLYVPVSLSAAYMSYFRDNPIALFRNELLRRFSFPAVYSTNAGFLIGEAMGRPEEHANNGLLGDLFTNLPFPLGLALLPLILVICFRLLDATGRGLPEKLVVSVCAFFAMSFSNGSWSSVLLSNGFLITCLLLYIFPKEEGLSQ